MTDLQHTPAYTLTDVAAYTGVRVATLRNWVRGRTYKTKQETKWSGPLIRLSDPDSNLLSFINLVEAHVLSSLRQYHEIRMEKVRAALDYLEREFGAEHPLVDHHFLTDQTDLFIRELDQLINLSESGQLAIHQSLDRYLDRVVRDGQGRLLRLYPVGTYGVEGLRPVVVDPNVGFGKPLIDGTRVPVEVVVERLDAGEAIEELADDYRCNITKLQAAIAWKPRLLSRQASSIEVSA